MQNDLIVFEFSNRDGREVLLNPAYVEQIAVSLGLALRANLGHLGPLVLLPETQFEIYLAAAKPGSIKLGFRAILRHIKIPNSDAIQTADAASNLVVKAAKLLAYAGITLGYFYPVLSDDKSLTVEAPSTALADKNVRAGIENLTTTALNTGADEVIIRIPDAPACTIVDGSTNPEFLGDEVPAINPQYVGDFEGDLKLIGEPIFVEHGGIKKQMLLGRVTMKRPRPPQNPPTEELTVLVDWQSALPAPSPSSTTHRVIGKLVALDRKQISALGAITHDHRRANGVLTVSKASTFL